MAHRKTKYVWDARVGKMVPVKTGREVVIHSHAASRSHWNAIAMQR